MKQSLSFSISSFTTSTILAYLGTLFFFCINSDSEIIASFFALLSASLLITYTYKHPSPYYFQDKLNISTIYSTMIPPAIFNGITAIAFALIVGKDGNSYFKEFIMIFMMFGLFILPLVNLFQVTVQNLGKHLPQYKRTALVLFTTLIVSNFLANVTAEPYDDFFKNIFNTTFGLTSGVMFLHYFGKKKYFLYFTIEIFSALVIILFLLTLAVPFNSTYVDYGSYFKVFNDLFLSSIIGILMGSIFTTLTDNQPLPPVQNRIVFRFSQKRRKLHTKVLSIFSKYLYKIIVHLFKLKEQKLPTALPNQLPIKM